MSDFMEVDGLDEDKTQTKKKRTTKKVKEDQKANEQYQTPHVENANTSSEKRYNIVDLPCNGKLNYPSTINYREMLFGDQKVLASASDDTYLRTLNNTLKSILNDCEFYEQLSIHTRDYLLFWIFANNYGTHRELQIECPSCGNVDKHTVDLTKLNVINLSDDFVEPFNFKTEKGKDIAIYAMRVKDELHADKFIRSQMEEKSKTSVGDMETAMVASSLDVGKALDLKSKIQWVDNNLTVKDMQIIARYHEYFTFGVDDLITHECTECGKEIEGRVPLHDQGSFRGQNVSADFESLLESNKRTEASTE